MFGLVVIEVMTPSGHLSNVNEILFSSPPKDLLKRFMRFSHQMDLIYYLSKSIGVLEKFSMRSIFKI